MGREKSKGDRKMTASEKTITDALEEKEEFLNREIIRLETFAEFAQDESSKNYNLWLKSIYCELRELYVVADLLIERIKLNEVFMRKFLGLNTKASDDEVSERAKDFGKLVENIIERARQMEEENREREMNK